MEATFICPECGETFSKREAKLREAHILEEHQAYLRWRCHACSYLVQHHRRYDLEKHWAKKHFGPFQPPTPVLVDKAKEDQRLEELRRGQSSLRRSPSRGTRHSPRSRGPSGKRAPSSSASPRRQDPPQPPRSPFIRSPRPSSSDARSPPRRSRQPTKAPPPAPVPVQPIQQEEELELHAPTDEEEQLAGSDREDDGARGGASPPPRSPPAERDLPTAFDQALTFVREEGTWDECRALVAAAEDRFPRISRGLGHQPAFGGQQLPRGGQGEARSRLTWHPSGSVSLDSGPVHVMVEGPVQETVLGDQPPQ